MFILGLMIVFLAKPHHFIVRLIVSNRERCDLFVALVTAFTSRNGSGLHVSQKDISESLQSYQCLLERILWFSYKRRDISWYSFIEHCHQDSQLKTKSPSLPCLSDLLFRQQSPSHLFFSTQTNNETTSFELIKFNVILCRRQTRTKDNQQINFMQCFFSSRELLWWTRKQTMIHGS